MSEENKTAQDASDAEEDVAFLAQVEQVHERLYNDELKYFRELQAKLDKELQEFQVENFKKDGEDTADNGIMMRMKFHYETKLKKMVGWLQEQHKKEIRRQNSRLSDLELEIILMKEIQAKKETSWNEQKKFLFSFVTNNRF